MAGRKIDHAEITGRSLSTGLDETIREHMSPAEFERQHEQRFDGDFYSSVDMGDDSINHTRMTDQELTEMLDEVERKTGVRPNTLMTAYGVFPIYSWRRSAGKQPRWVRVRISVNRLFGGDVCQ